MTAGAAFCCHVCGGTPTWSLTRRGDVAATWACDRHLAQTCSELQRDFEVTEIIVTRFNRPFRGVLAIERLDAQIRRELDLHSQTKESNES